MCTHIYTHTHTHTYTYKETYKELAYKAYKELAHMIMEAEKSQDLESASWRPGDQW